MKRGDRVIWKPIDHRDKSQDTSHRWYGAGATVLEAINLDRVIIALDDFPDCNHRAYHNRFCADIAELELIGK